MSVHAFPSRRWLPEPAEKPAPHVALREIADKLARNGAIDPLETPALPVIPAGEPTPVEDPLLEPRKRHIGAIAACLIGVVLSGPTALAFGLETAGLAGAASIVRTIPATFFAVMYRVEGLSRKEAVVKTLTEHTNPLLLVRPPTDSRVSGIVNNVAVLDHRVVVYLSSIRSSPSHAGVARPAGTARSRSRVKCTRSRRRAPGRRPGRAG